MHVVYFSSVFCKGYKTFILLHQGYQAQIVENQWFMQKRQIAFYRQIDDVGEMQSLVPVTVHIAITES
jgi:hypothetical protein